MNKSVLIGVTITIRPLKTMIDTQEKKDISNAFYKEALEILNETGCNYLLGGAFAMFQYTGIFRETKDLDIFCKSSEYTKILKHFADLGYETELTDVRWLAKIYKGDYFIDIIFDTVNNICRVDDTWFEHASTGEFHGIPVQFIPAEELIWCKIYVQNRERNDSADINHTLLKHGKQLDWERLFSRLDQHWHLLLAQFISFQFVYPSDYRKILPKWLFEELLKRAQEQYDVPASLERVCRGPLIDQTQYEVDIKEWNYKSYTIKTV